MTAQPNNHPYTAYILRKLTRGCWRRGFMSAWLLGSLLVAAAGSMARATPASAQAAAPESGPMLVATEDAGVTPEKSGPDVDQVAEVALPKRQGAAATPVADVGKVGAEDAAAATVTDAGQIAPASADSLEDQSCGSGNGRIDPAYEQEDWSVDASAGETLVIKAIRTSGNLDGWLTLFDPYGNTVAYDDDSAGDLNPLIRYTVTRSGRYGITVSSYQWASTGDYRLEVCWVTETTSCPDSQYTAHYFNNMYLGGSPAVTRCEDWPIDHDWAGGRPVDGVGDNNFSVRWTGRAYIQDGTYRFIARADDGIRVWIGGELIIDAWRDQGATTYERERRVTSGTYDIRVEYYENGGSAVAQFRWERGTIPPTCQGTWLNMGDAPTGYVGTGGRQTYCFRGDGGRWISVRAVALGGGLDPVVRLYLPNGDTVENDDATGYGTNSMLVAGLPQSTVYRLEIRGYASTSGDYRMHLGLNRKATVADVNSTCSVDEGDRWLVQNFLGEASYNDERYHADINLDGVVNANDLAYVLSHWGLGCQ